MTANGIKPASSSYSSYSYSSSLKAPVAAAEGGLSAVVGAPLDMGCVFCSLTVAFGSGLAPGTPPGEGPGAGVAGPLASGMVRAPVGGLGFGVNAAVLGPGAGIPGAPGALGTGGFAKGMVFAPAGGAGLGAVGAAGFGGAKFCVAEGAGGATGLGVGAAVGMGGFGGGGTAAVSPVISPGLAFNVIRTVSFFSGTVDVFVSGWSLML